MANTKRDATSPGGQADPKGKAQGTSPRRTSRATTSRAATSAAIDDAPNGFAPSEFMLAQQLQEKADAAADAAAAAADEAATAADAAYAAREALVMGARPPSGSPAQPDPQFGPQTGSQGGGTPPVGGGSDGYLGMMSGLLEGMGSNNWNADKFEDMSQGVNMVLGSGPAFAALGSMLANSTAQGAVLMNATQMQRQLDQVGLCCTSACVQQLLNLNTGSGDRD